MAKLGEGYSGFHGRSNEEQCIFDSDWGLVLILVPVRADDRSCTVGCDMMVIAWKINARSHFAPAIK